MLFEVTHALPLAAGVGQDLLAQATVAYAEHIATTVEMMVAPSKTASVEPLADFEEPADGEKKLDNNSIVYFP